MSLTLMLFASFVVQVIYAGNPELPDAALSPEASRPQGNSSNIALSPLDAKSQISPRSNPLDDTRAPHVSKRSAAKPAPPSDAKPGSKRSQDKTPDKSGKNRFLGLKFGATKDGGFNAGFGLPSVGLTLGDQSQQQQIFGEDAAGGAKAGGAPAGGAPAGGAPAGAAPAGGAPAGGAPASGAPAGGAGAGGAPAGGAPAGGAPAGGAPAGGAPADGAPAAPPAGDTPAKDAPAGDAAAGQQGQQQAESRKGKYPVRPQSKSGTKG